MALKAGRVGVAPSEVNALGKIIGGEAPDAYTKPETDALLLLKEDAANIGGLKFRDNSGQAQYKLPNGDWSNFSSGGGSAPALIWTNSDPTLSFGGKIEFTTPSDATHLIIECAMRNNLDVRTLSIVEIGSDSALITGGFVLVSNVKYYGLWKVSNILATEITFDRAYAITESQTISAVSDCTATRIWAIKAAE